MDDDIYGNLENYNEVNVVEELKNENKELKFKLEEYSSAMSALQKDFDKLNSEYKKLEYNYTSLLKTARAEIERKTLMITQLNKDKDLLVIKSIQNTGRNILNKIVYGNDSQAFEESKIRDTVKKDETSANEKKYNKPVSNMTTKEVPRVQPYMSASPIGSMSSIDTAGKSTSSEYNVRKNSCEKDGTDGKENILKTLLEQQLKDSTKAKTKKIMNRRKSMPVPSNFEQIYSSDDDYIEESRFPDKKDRASYNIREHKGNSVYEKRNFKTGESFTKESYNTHGSETFRDRKDAHHRSHKRSFRRFSPEKDRYRSHRIQDRYSRLDDRHQRDTERSSSNKYNRSKSRDNRYQERDYDRVGSKHKWSDFDSDERLTRREPDNKRRKIESMSTDTEHVDRLKCPSSSKHTESRAGDVAHKNDELSCQSPEYTQMDTNVIQQVKEIKSTATLETTLEDPRITSKKYVVKNVDNRNFLITTNASDLDMIPVDRSRWGLEKVEVPEALKEYQSSEKSTETTEIHDIYKDIDNPDWNVSMESGEICQDNLYNQEKKVTAIYPSQDVKLCHNEQRRLPAIDNDCTTHVYEQEHKKNLTNYKIPKKSQNEQSSKSKLDDIHQNKETQAKDRRNEYKNSIKLTLNPINETLSKHDKFESIKESLAGDLELSDEASDLTDDLQINDDRDNRFRNNFFETNHAAQNRQHNNEQALTSENLSEIQKKTKNNSKEEIPKEKCKEKAINKKNKNEAAEKTSRKQEKNTTKIITDENFGRINKKMETTKTSLGECEDTISEDIDEVKCTLEKKSNKNVECKNIDVGNEKIAKSTLENKSKKSKNRSKTDGECDNLGILNIDSNINNNPGNKEKEQKPTKKFTELFGESSSLITPDDLGMPTKIEAKNKGNNKFVSLFDNTQDAIDLNVEEFKKIQSTERDSKDTHFEDKTKESDGSNNENVVIGLLSKVNSEEPVVNVYENLKPQINHDPNVVKTVIISTGVQPVVEQSKTESVENVLSSNKIEHFHNKRLPLDLLQALATSTPHKIPSDILTSLPENSSTEHGETNNTDFSLSNTSQSSGTQPIVPEAGAPDVRMFVRRRKRIKKAP